MKRDPYTCQHGWVQPGDGWMVEETPGIRIGFRKRRCVLCKKIQIQKYNSASKTWNATEQLTLVQDG